LKMSKIKLPDKTDKKPTNPMARSTSFKKGNKANPNGRPKGSLNEVTKFKEALKIFEKEQQKSIYKILLNKALVNPQVLIAIFKALVPQQSESNIKVTSVYEEYENMTDEELIEHTIEIIKRTRPYIINKDID